MPAIVVAIRDVGVVASVVAIVVIVVALVPPKLRICAKNTWG